jgi:putative ATP-dependent endonuclease of OLD family
MIDDLAPTLSGPRDVSAPTIFFLAIRRFRGIKALSWHPAASVNIILGGGDVGKTTILDAIALLLSPTASAILSDTDYYARRVADGFEIEAVIGLPPQTGIDYQLKPSWPWEWNGTEAVIPDPVEQAPIPRVSVYRLRVRGTEDLDLAYEIIQPDGTTDSLSVALRRSIGLVRLGGDDRNDRDLRLVQGSALDRLLSDKSLRSRMAVQLAKSEVREQLLPDKKDALTALNEIFVDQRLPNGLDLSIIGGQGASIASMVGLTATIGTVQLPLANWGAGTRRLSALAVAQQNQGQAPITVVDELERGLEPYRQRVLVDRLQGCSSQSFATTHSPFVIGAASKAALWYVDGGGQVGSLDDRKLKRIRHADPRSFLSRLTVVAEGATEVGFVGAMLERVLESHPAVYGLHLCDGGGQETTLEILEALIKSGLRFAGFADEEGKHPGRWSKIQATMGTLLFRWPAGCTEEFIISAVPDDQLEALLIDPTNEKTGDRLRTVALRLNVEGREKDFATVSAKAGANLRTVMIGAALGRIPENKAEDRKVYQSHAQDWFKTRAGGKELAAKVFSLGLWPDMRDLLLPFLNAIRKALELPEIGDVNK